MNKSDKNSIQAVSQSDFDNISHANPSSENLIQKVQDIETGNINDDEMVIKNSEGKSKIIDKKQKGIS